VGRALVESLHWALRLPDWQPWKAAGPNTIWHGVHGAYRLPVFILYLAFVIRHHFGRPPKHLAHLIALSAAALIGIHSGTRTTAANTCCGICRSWF